MAQFARCMALKGERNVGGADAVTVIRDLNQPAPAVHDLDGNSGAAGIQAVVDQFFYNGGWPLDDLARRNATDDLTRQDVDFS
jgi:hypothetical protein